MKKSIPCLLLSISLFYAESSAQAEALITSEAAVPAASAVSLTEILKGIQSASALVKSGKELITVIQEHETEVALTGAVLKEELNKVHDHIEKAKVETIKAISDKIDQKDLEQTARKIENDIQRAYKRFSNYTKLGGEDDLKKLKDYSEIAMTDADNKIEVFWKEYAFAVQLNLFAEYESARLNHNKNYAVVRGIANDAANALLTKAVPHLSVREHFARALDKAGKQAMLTRKDGKNTITGFATFETEEPKLGKVLVWASRLGKGSVQAAGNQSNAEDAAEEWARKTRNSMKSRAEETAEKLEECTDLAKLFTFIAALPSNR